MKRPAVVLAALLALCVTVAACSNTPQDMTVHGTVTLRSVNGVPPADAYSGYGGVSEINLQLEITADDGYGNYQGQPWNQAEAQMTLESSTAKVITYTFTAQIPDDAQLYQISALCCMETVQGQDFTLQEMQQGVALCYGDGCAL